MALRALPPATPQPGVTAREENGMHPLLLPGGNAFPGGRLNPEEPQRCV